jgi:hypothetical protein
MLKKRDPIEKILLDREKITEKTLEEIKQNDLITEKTLEEIKQNDFQKGKYLGKVLVDHGYIHSQVILEILSEELGYPYLQASDLVKSDLPVPDSGNLERRIGIPLPPGLRPCKERLARTRP